MVRVKRKPETPAAARTPKSPDEREETFWNTPGAAARTLHFTGDSLLDEEVDLANVSTASFGTPIAHPRKLAAQVEPGVKLQEPTEHPDEFDEEDEVDQALGDPDETAEPTIVLRKAAALHASEVHTPPEPTPPPEPVEVAEAPPSPPSIDLTAAATPHHRQKVKVTTELERIVVRLTP